MSEFSASDYFARKVKEADAAELANPTQDKYLALQRATAEKVQKLDAMAKTSAKREALNDASWVGQLGLEPGEAPAVVTNLAANVYQDASRMAGNIAALPKSIAADTDLAKLTGEETDAINRYQKGQASAADLQLINTPKVLGKSAGAPKADLTPLQRFERQIANRAEARNLREVFDRSGAVHGDDKEQLAQGIEAAAAAPWEDVRAGFKQALAGDVVAGSGKLLKGLAQLDSGITEAVKQNPSGAVQHAASNVAQIGAALIPGVGPAIMAGDNMSMGFDNLSKGIEKHASENQGAVPDKATQQTMANWAAAGVLAEQAADVLTLGAGLGKRVLGKAADGLAAPGNPGALMAATRATVTGAASEAPTEAFQTYAEGEAGLSPATAAQVISGGVIGGLAGAQISGGLRTATAVPEAAAAAVTKLNESRKQEQGQGAALDAAIASGDTSTLTDPKSPDYAPAKAVAALYGNSQLDTATPEIKQANLEKAGEIVAGLEEQRAAAQERYALVSPERVEADKAALAQAQEKLAAIDPADTAAKAALQEEVALRQEVVADAASAPEAASRLQKQMERLDGQLTEARTHLAVFTQEQQSADVDVATEVATISAPVDAADTTAVAAKAAAVERVINLSMAVPERLDTRVATQLAEDTSNGLTEAQRTYLRAFSEARVAENTLRSMDEVSQRVYFGKDSDVGIKQYRERVASALATGNRKVADRNLTSLSNFEADHKAKADLVVQAKVQMEATGTPVEVLSNGNGGWFISQAPRLSTEARTKNGGLILHRNTPATLVDGLVAEADALTKALNELNAAYAVKFPTATPKASNVSITPEASQAQDQASTNVDAPVEAAGSPTKATKPTVAPAVGGNAPGKPRKIAAPARVSESTAVNTVDQVATATTAGLQTTQPSTVEPQSLEESKESNTVDAQPTEVQNSTESAEQTLEEVAETAAPVALESGSLSAFSSKSAENTPFNARNLIADYFKQSIGSEGASTQRPLVAVKNFMGQTTTGILEFLDNKVLTDAQQGVLQLFRQKNTAWGNVMQANLYRKPNPDFFYEDMMQYLVQDTDTGLAIDENVKTAMAYSGFSWIAENAMRSRFNSPEEINAILNRDEDAPVSSMEERALLNIGTRHNVVANALGQRAVQALGLRANADAPLNLMANLESAMGEHVLKMLLDRGILERTTITGEEMAQMTGSPDTDANANHNFIKLARNEEGALAAEAEEIFQASRSTSGVLDKLFSVEPGLKEPSLEPIPFTQTRTKNTNQGVPEKLAKIIEHENSVPSLLRQDMWHLVSGMDAQLVAQMAGAVSEDGTQVHSMNLLSNQAKNDGLARELTRFKDFISAMPSLDAPMYFDHVVWKQQRVGIATNAVNPQTSKIHRHMLYRPTWDTKVERSDPAQMENFQLRVLEGLGVKTDKQSNEKSLEDWEKRTQAPEIVAAVDVLIKRIDGADLSLADQEVLVAGVKKGGENFHSLDALMALAHEKRAGDSDFNVQLMGEVDGVTNGPILSHLMLGAAESVEDAFRLLNRGGIFEEGNPNTQYNLYRGTPGNLDLYETTIKDVLTNLNQLTKLPAKDKQKVDSSVLPAIYAFTGELESEQGDIVKAGRNIIKTPLTAMVFGSTVTKAIDSMADKFIAAIYEKIEDAAKGKSGAMSAQEIAAHLDTLGVQIPRNVTIEQLMKAELSKGEYETLKATFTNSIGKAVKVTMASNFGVFIARRKQLNEAAELTFELYNAAYTALREETIKDLMGAESKEPGTGIPFATDKAGVRTPKHDLTQAQEKDLRQRLKALTPVMHTPMSKDSGSLNAGLRMSKTARKLSQKATHKGRIQFGTSISGSKVWSTKQKAFIEQTAVSSTAYETVETAPGVAMSPMSAHSADSAISHYAADGSEVLNVHDAHGAGLGTFEKTAKNLNQNTWNVLLDYSPANEVFQALSRTVRGLGSLVQEEGVSLAVAQKVADAIWAFEEKHDSPGSGFAATLPLMKREAFNADSMKLQTMQRMSSVDQYALQGGNYSVTDADRAKAADLQTKLVDSLTEEEHTAIEAISAAVAKVSPAEDTQVDRQEVEEPLQAPPAKSEMGALGKSTIDSDPALVEFFTANPDVQAIKVIHHLESLLREKGGRVSQVNMLLLQAAKKAVNPRMRVRYVTPDTLESSVLEKPKDNARGWYVAKGTQEEIYLLSPEFLHSGLTTETLLHELTHAAVARVVAQELAAKAANPKYTSEALALVDELEVLRSKATALVDKEGITGFGAALADVQEFIAWGMTNQKFQREVIAKTSIQSKTRKNSLVAGMKAFIDSIVGLLFKGSDKSRQAITVNGMTALVQNVSGLYAQASLDQGNADVNLSMASDPMGTVNTFSTLDIHEALNAGGISPEFDTRLQGLLRGIVEKLHGPFGAFKADLMQNQAMTAMDVWMKALDTGSAPLALSAQASPLTVSEREAHALEQVEATVREALVTTKFAYKELATLYTEARKKLTPESFHTGDWATATPDEKAAAQAKHDYLFKIDRGADGRSDYLARFAAFGLAHEETNKLLQFTTAVNQKERPKTFADRLQGFFEAVLAFFSKTVTGAYAGQQADAKLATLVGHLVDIEAKKRASIARSGTGFNPLSQAEDAVKSFADGARAKVGEIAGSNFVRNSSNGLVKGAGALARTYANDHVEGFLEGINRLRDREFNNRQGVLAGLLNDVRGPAELLKGLLLQRKNTERNRKEIITTTAKNVLGLFANKGADLSKQAKAGISAVFLRTGLHVLTDNFTMSEIQGMLENSTDLAAAVTALEGQLNSYGNLKHDFIAQANVLGYYKATGRTRGEGMMMNAHNIVQLYGTGIESGLTQAQSQQAEKIVEQLIALYSLGYVGSVHKAEAKEVLRSESQRSEGNGAEALLKLHKALETESKERLFKGNPALMVHGYTPEIYNPHVDIQVVSEEEGKELLALGYSQGAAVKRDPADPDAAQKHIYVLKDGGLQPYLTGIVSFTGKAAKGTEKRIAAAKGVQGGQRRLYGSGPRADLSKATGSFLAPVVNDMGEAVSWRYLMNDSTKDSLLDRDNRFEKMLGALAGAIYDKQTTREQNAQALQAARDTFKAEYASQPAAFITVGPNSTDPEMREIWNMLPEDTKKDVQKVWGREDMQIRKDALDILFGYRKLSAATMFKELNDWRKRKEQRIAQGLPPDEKNPLNHLERLFTGVVENLLTVYARTKGMNQADAERYSRRAGVVVTRSEHIWQEMVRETKDLIVVKTGVVMVGNIWSNLSLLALQGVPLKDIVSTHLVALKGATQYRNDSEELARLQNLLSIGHTQGKEAEIQRDIIRLEDSLARNPVKELIDAGLMPTIVEDIAADDDIYSYKSAFVRKTEAVTNKLNPTVVAAAKQVYMGHDTKMYQGLSRITQLSDFVARYTLYQHLINKKKNPLSKEQAVMEASDAFVNYDIPMHRNMQYTDDMGITMFTKYILRIQKVLLKLARENPGRVMATLALNNFVDLGPIVLDSSALTRIGNNPFTTGALKFPETLDDLATVSAAMSLIK